MNTTDFQGLFPPIPTPFDEHEGLALDQLKANLKRWNACGFSGYVVIGSNGEFVHLSERERLAALETAREAIPDDRLLIAGCTLESTQQIIEFTQQLERLGASAVLVNAPSYYKQVKAPEQLLIHYRRIADGSPLPILLYNVPQLTNVTIPPPVVAQLAEHPNIKGLKDSSGDIAALAQILRLVPEGFRVLSGSAPTYYPALALGAQGGILAVASVAWEACHELMQAVRQSEAPRARELQLRLLPVAAAVTTQFGIAGLKAALPLRGFYGGPPRSPLPDVDEKMRAEIERIFRASGLPGLNS